jgi:hypothetical protein
MNLAMENLKVSDHGPLFKYAYSGDILRDFDLNKFIYVRVCKNLIEAILLNGVREWEIKVLAYMLNHVVGQMFVNIPTNEDNAKLHHIFNVTKGSETKDIYNAISKNVDPQSYPMHFVLYAKWNVEGSSLMHQMNKKTVGRLLKAYKTERKDLVTDFYI